MRFLLTRHSRLAFTVVAVAVVAGCGKESAPAVAPDVPPGAPPPPPAELSQFSVPIEYDFSPLLGVVERAVPLHFGSLDSVHMVGTDSRRHYAFEADRDAFTAYAAGPVVRLEATIAYAAKVFYKPPVAPTITAGCGGDLERRPRISLSLSTPITLTSDWKLRSRVRLDSLGPTSSEQRDRCDVSILHYDVTPRVVDAARSAIEARLGELDRKIGEVDLDSRFRYWWRLLAHPIRLTDGVWLLIEPERLAMGDVSGRNHMLNVPVLLTARPRIVTSTALPAAPARSLPPLGHNTAKSGFRVLLDGTIDYAAASRLIGTTLVNKTISERGRRVIVTGVLVAPAEGGRLSLTVDFIGDAHGTLVFRGSPVIDSVRRQVSVPDLDYDLATDDRILGSFAWLRSDAIRAAFREKSQFPIDSALARARSMLLLGLNRTIGGVLTLSATVDSVAVRGLYVTREGLVVRAEARGKARVKVSQR